jgi:hypothetical protein
MQRPIPEAFNGIKLANTETSDNTQAGDWLETRNWPDWLKEDFLDLLDTSPDLYEMSKDDIEKTIKALRNTAQDFLDTANSLESQADLLARYLNEKV